ncbi:MAG: class I SAM-dependent methyltransferase [Nitrosomonadales bacterium]|nr:MAG: class I SAM-dependent methyltransferase [Nitrosomonadales bacterium]
MTSKTEIKNGAWVKESAFGIWFTGTETWVKYVLTKALDDLESMTHNRNPSYPVILDVGCGHGLSFPILEKRFNPKKIIGLDVDPMTQSRTQRNIALCNCEIQIQNNNASNIDLKDNSVDMLFCHQTFHHLVEQEQAIQEFFRVLKPGGVLLFAESCRRYIYSFLIRFLFRHPMDVQKSDLEYIELIRATGFDLEEQNISRPFLWWSREDLGILEFFHLPENQENREETMVNLVAYKT